MENQDFYSYAEIKKQCENRMQAQKQPEQTTDGQAETTQGNASQTDQQKPDGQAGTTQGTASQTDEQKTDKHLLFVSPAYIRFILQGLLVILLIFLFLFIISPVFVHLDSLGNPTTKEQDGSIKEQKQDPAFDKSIDASLKSEKLLPLDASFKMDLYKGNQSSSSFKYVNAAMSIAAYLLGIIFLATICYRINKSLQRDKLIRENNETFQDFFTKLSPKHEEYKEMFVQEIMRIYFNKKGE